MEATETWTETAARAEKDLERPMTLHTHRLNQVATTLKELEAKSVLDLGCGEGKLLRRLLADRAFERIVGMDVSHRSLEIASAKLRLERMPERQRKRIQIMQGSLLYRDTRLNGFDAAALVEVIEHLDTPRLAALERTSRVRPSAPYRDRRRRTANTQRVVPDVASGQDAPQRPSL